MVFARCRLTVSRAKASITSETWRCQPCQLRVSWCSSPSSFLAVSNPSSIAQRRPSTPTKSSSEVPPGHQVVKQARLASEAAPDEQAARPKAGLRAADLVGREVRQLQIGPVVEPRALGAVAGRETHPG